MSERFDYASLKKVGVMIQNRKVLCSLIIAFVG